MPSAKDDAKAANRVVPVASIGWPRDSGHDYVDGSKIEMKLGSQLIVPHRPILIAQQKALPETDHHHFFSQLDTFLLEGYSSSRLTGIARKSWQVTVFEPFFGASCSLG